ncbi:MAG: hypothetical protein JOZ33_09130, partial [Acidobacteriaceae bacterium]|nr:hypothetical protein [Acidobacteriaceae bacterium]
MKTMRILSTAVMLVVCASVPALAGVKVNSPNNETEVSSPFTLSANAATCSSESVSAMGYSFDSSSNTAVVYTQSIEGTVAGPAGPHTLHVKAWGEKGSSCVTDIKITVKSGAVPEGSDSNIPSNAISVSNIEVLSGWKGEHDDGGPGSSSGSTTLVSSPSLSGNSRQFVTAYSNGGDHRYSVHFADDVDSKNFFYDGWVYLTDSSKNVGNLELDINQTMANGQTVLTGVQCDGYAGEWAYTVNKGSAKHPKPHWDTKSGTSCNPRNWSTNTWHHVQASLSRDDSGYITYHSVWLDGAETQLNATVFGAADLGWGDVITTQFQ